MAGLFGNIGAFEEQTESFQDYAGRFEAFVAANEVHQDKQANLFLATIGPHSYKLVKSLCDPANPNSKTYAQLKQLMKDHFEPAPITIAERHKFWTASQADQESVSDFGVRLKNLASTCTFGAFLDDALRDRLVSGLHPKMSRVQRHLLGMRDLTFKKAHEECVADELASKANREHMGEAAAQAHRVGAFSYGKKKSKGSSPSKPQGSSSSKPQGSSSKWQSPSQSQGEETCPSCGSTRHRRDKCKYKDATCHKCNRKGHIRPVCRAKTPERHPGPRKSKVHNVASGSDDDDDGNVYCNDHKNVEYTEGFGLYNMQHDRDSTHPYIVKPLIGSANVTMEIDTGASRSTVSEYVYNALL
jgi:hypothetical protein